MRRRAFIAGLGGAAAWPMLARAQQLPVIGFLGTESPELWSDRISAFRQGLSDLGFEEGRNVAIEFRWANGQQDRLSKLANELVRRDVAVIVAPGSAPAALAAQAASKTIPIVFETSGDPVQLGLIASLNRPGAKITGVTSLGMQVVPKRLELLCELVPTLTSVAVLINPNNPVSEGNLAQLEPIARALRVQLQVLEATKDNDLEKVFSTIMQSQAGALLIVPDPFLTAHAALLGKLAADHSIPAIYQYRDFVTAGGLMSYGATFTRPFRQVGVYTGRVLNGERPADLPVQQTTNVELIINLKAAKGLKLSVPLTLLGRADEVIE
jgi:ABC-type uncharacterized transport system substrate-binding protein